MTPDYIAFHAAERPNAVAVIDSGREVTYREFDRHIANVAAGLREFGLPRGGIAAIECEDLYAHWLLLLAFERLGVGTASLGPNGAERYGQFFPLFDFIVSQHPPAGELLRRHHTITAAWIKSLLSADNERMPGEIVQADEDRLRIGFTSGTTGALKAVAYSRRAFEGHINKWVWRCGLSSEARYLITIPFTVEGAYHHATACIRAGGTAVLEISSEDVGELLTRHGISQVTLFPLQLKRILDRLPSDYIKPRSLTITTLGSALSPALRARATTRLANQVYETYGCNEIGFVCSTAGDGDIRGGAIFPGVQVDIVDEHDRSVEIGQIGRIRLKSDTMVGGYLGNPQATKGMFRDGWFYPGDLGALRAPRRLAVTGREDELLNIGGTKVQATEVEAYIAAHTAVSEVAVCALANADGVGELWIAVSGAEITDDILMQRIYDATRHWPLGLFHVVRLSHIPRTATGKIERSTLQKTLAASSPRTAPG